MTTSEKQKFVIVKYASEGYWHHYFKQDPKRMGVSVTFSACYTYSGREAKLEPFYESLEQAQSDLSRIRELNPSVGYDICPLLEFTSQS